MTSSSPYESIERGRRVHHQSRSYAKGYDPSVRSLFHARPLDIQGETLYRLNQLKDIHPDLCEHETPKFGGREAVLEFRIPLLDVLWNDTHSEPQRTWRLDGKTVPSRRRRRGSR